MWIGTSRCAERRALAQALREGEVGAHKWNSTSFRHFRYFLVHFLFLSQVLGRLRVLRVKTCKLCVTCKTRNPHRKMYGFTRNNAQETRERVYGFLRVIYQYLILKKNYIVNKKILDFLWSPLCAIPSH